MALAVPLRGQRHESGVAQFLVVRLTDMTSRFIKSLGITLTLGFTLGLIAYFRFYEALLLWAAVCMLVPVLVMFLVREKPYLWGLVPGPVMFVTAGLLWHDSRSFGDFVLESMMGIFMSMLLSVPACFLIYIRRKI